MNNSHMNKSMLIGIVAGVAIAAAGAVVAGYALRDDAPATEISGVDPSAATDAAASAQTNAEASAPAEQPAATVAQAPAAPATPKEVCWDETVTHTAEPKDDKKIAGTAIGAVIGGVIGHQFGGGTGKTVATAAGAAAGAYGGRKAQDKYQEGNTYTTTERRCKTVE